MRYSEFRDLVDDVLGPVGPTLVRDQVLGPLGERTAQEALDDGVEPRAVWRALCDAMDVPEALRWGHDRPRRARD
ncbi:hypothetical protein N866_01255 [Actinotalea ferrariae CF5-4]|uniref:Signal transduction histidine kinase n=1 Tax=Actinotalea ferrariae CF5-4 TaxID=948458 RepID=A0A021VWD2_9CELL|nr:DUF3046 domain-containing protein [Actinotalea ferrariae]EYR63352.1 hypothetical protein N866_01255 [Actinotalea ferrariae CF5-4]